MKPACSVYIYFLHSTMRIITCAHIRWCYTGLVLQLTCPASQSVPIYVHSRLTTVVLLPWRHWRDVVN